MNSNETKVVIVAEKEKTFLSFSLNLDGAGGEMARQALLPAEICLKFMTRRKTKTKFFFLDPPLLLSVLFKDVKRRKEEKKEMQIKCCAKCLVFFCN